MDSQEVSLFLMSTKQYVTVKSDLSFITHCPPHNVLNVNAFFNIRFQSR